jgi:hypothetical protein
MANLDQGGDSFAPTTIDDIFSSTESDVAVDDSTEQPEAAEESEVADSGTDETEQPTETDETASEEAQPGELTAEALAKQYGFDLNNPAHRKAINRMLEDAKYRALDAKRVKDSQDYIASLKEKISRGDFLAKFENDLFKSKARSEQQPVQQTQQRPAVDSPAPLQQFRDGYDHWKSAADAEKEYGAAWESGDQEKASAIRVAFNNRWFKEAAEPYVDRMIDQAIERRMGPVIQRDRSVQQRQMEEDARFEALDAIRAGDPDMAKLLEEMFKPDGKTIEINGKQEPSNAIWKLTKEYPEIYDIRVDRGNPQESARATWARRYLALAKLHMNQKRQSAIATEKGEKIFKAGQQTAAAQAQKEKVRQSITSGTSKGKARQLSADDQFMAELSQSGGVVGIPQASLFR